MKNKAKPMKPNSLRDSLALTVRLLTQQGIKVHFRGHTPHVISNPDGDAEALVLPELSDSTPPEVIEALHGFLDHEVGHVLYTPFKRSLEYSKGRRDRAAMANIVEDVRLEKLLPRDLPGARNNLERMYESVMESYFGGAKKAHDTDKVGEQVCAVMVTAIRAYAGQKAFAKFMDDNDLWKFFDPVLSRVPDLPERLKRMETYREVEVISNLIIAALENDKDAMKEIENNQKMLEEEVQQGGDADQQQEESDEYADDIDPDWDDDGDASGDSDDADDSDDGDGQESDDAGDSGDDADDQSNGEGDDDEEDGVPSGESDDAESGDDSDQSSGDGSDDGGSDTDTDEAGDGDGDGQPVSLRDALDSLDPACRRALFLQKRKGKSMSQIASDLDVSESEARNLVKQARSKLHERMSGE